MTDYIKQHSTTIEFTSESSWIILNPIEKRIKDKIEHIGLPLKDWDISINYGIKTGCNEAFIIDKIKCEEIVAKDKNSAEIIRPILRGRDIKRYGYDSADLYLLFIPWHFPLHLDATITGVSKIAEERFKKEYPTVYAHLFQYKDILSARNAAETGIRYEWYALQRWGANYWEDFSKQKITWARLMRISRNDLNDFPRFSLVPKDFFVADSLCFITGSDLLYLLGILNSEFAKYYFFSNVAVLDDGGMQMRQQFIELMPIPLGNEKTKRNITNLVVKLNTENHKHKEDEINNLVYTLYGFDQNEIKQIKSVIEEKTVIIRR